MSFDIQQTDAERVRETERALLLPISQRLNDVTLSKVASAPYYIISDTRILDIMYITRVLIDLLSTCTFLYIYNTIIVSIFLTHNIYIIPTLSSFVLNILYNIDSSFLFYTRRSFWTRCTDISPGYIWSSGGEWWPTWMRKSTGLSCSQKPCSRPSRLIKINW